MDSEGKREKQPLYGAFLQLAGRRCLIVGGGRVAERKAEGLLSCGAVVEIIAPEITPGIAAHVKKGTISWIEKSYQSGDATAYFLIVAATPAPDVNRQVATEAEALGKLVNVVNDPQLGNFQVPAMVRRGRLTIGVSTAGASPAVAKRIREQLEAVFGEEYAEYLELLAEVRAHLQHTIAEERKRTAIMQKLAGSDLLALLQARRREEAERLVADIIGGQ